VIYYKVCLQYQSKRDSSFFKCHQQPQKREYCVALFLRGDVVCVLLSIVRYCKLFCFLAKSFIICVLRQILEHVKTHKNICSYPFQRQLIESCLKVATHDCELGMGALFTVGTKFNRSDIRTYWTTYEQFNTW